MTLDPAGRYRPVRTSLWPTFGALSSDARLVLLALLTGSTSNMAGITLLTRDTLRRETGLDPGQLEAALLELDKQPTPAQSFIVRDELVIWCRTALRDAPSVLNHVDRVSSGRHLTHIRGLLGSLPATSPTVQKFKRAYRLALNTPSQGVSQGASRVRRTDSDSDSDSETENREQIRRTERESEGKPNTAGDVSPAPPPSVVAPQASKHTRVNPEEESAPAFNGKTDRNNGNGQGSPRRFSMQEYYAELEATRAKHPNWPKEDIDRRVEEVLTGRKEPLATTLDEDNDW